MSRPQDEVSIAIDHEAWLSALPDAKELCRAAVAAALSAACPADRPVEVSLVLAGAGTVARLNRDYRGGEGATNVLAFPAGDIESPAGAADGEQPPLLLGDVVVCYEAASEEARSDGRSLADHLAHLVVHGLLHLLGHHHDADDHAERMEALEVAVLRMLGIANPYEQEHASHA